MVAKLYIRMSNTDITPALRYPRGLEICPRGLLG
jgi:hypothetical protein